MKRVILIIGMLLVCLASFGQTRPDWLDIKNKPFTHYLDNIKTGTDISTSLQAAINTIDGASLPSTGGTVYIPSGLYFLDHPIYVNGSSITIKGEGTLSTYLVVRQTATAAIQVYPGIASLWRAKFNMENICMNGIYPNFAPTAVYVLTSQGGIQNCTFLYFKDAIILRGCHFFSVEKNTFTGGFTPGGNGLKAESDVGGEGTCNQITLRNNIFENATLDLTDAANAIVDRNDFEGGVAAPIRLGTKTTFTENRLELRNLAYVPQQISTETVWLSIDGDDCRVLGNSFHALPENFSNHPAGLGVISLEHPIIQVNSNRNTIEWARNSAYNQFAIRFEPSTPGSLSDDDPQHNTVIITAPFQDRTRSGNGFLDSRYLITGVARNQITKFRRTAVESNFTSEGSSSLFGAVEEMGTSNTLLASPTVWGRQDIIATTTLSIASYPYGFSSASDSALFLQCEATATTGNRRVFLITPILAAGSSVVTQTLSLSALVYIPRSFDGKFYVGVNLDAVSYPIPADAGWFWVHYTTQIYPGEAIQPCFGYDDNVATASTKFILGCVSLVKGETPAFVFPTKSSTTRWSSFQYPK